MVNEYHIQEQYTKFMELELAEQTVWLLRSELFKKIVH